MTVGPRSTAGWAAGRWTGRAAAAGGGRQRPPCCIWQIAAVQTSVPLSRSCWTGLQGCAAGVDEAGGLQTCIPRCRRPSHRGPQTAPRALDLFISALWCGQRGRGPPGGASERGCPQPRPCWPPGACNRPANAPRQWKDPRSVA